MAKTSSQSTDARREAATRLCDMARLWVIQKISATHPWQGVDFMPVKANGLPYVGVNIPVLLAQMEEAKATYSGRFGSHSQHASAGNGVRKGEKAWHAIYAGRVAKKRDKKDDESKSTESSAPRPLDDDDEDAWTIQVFNSIPIFHISQTEKAPNDPAALSAANREIRVKEAKVDVDAMLLFAKKAKAMAAEHIAEFNAKQKKEGVKLTGVMATFIERLAADLVVAYHSGLGLRYAGKVNGIYPQECLSVLQGLSGGKIMRPWGIASAVMRECAPELDEQMKAATEEAIAKREAYKQKQAKEQENLWF